MNRRDFLTAATGLTATALCPDVLHAAAASAGGWTLAVADVEADIPRQAMRRLHGRCPPALEGVLYRNGPAKFHRPGGSAGHWFDGDGMVRAFRIDDGQASLTARFMDTPKRRQDTAANAVITPGFGTPIGKGASVSNNDEVNAANISVMSAGGEMWALWENGSPMVFDPETLQSKGFRTLRPDLARMPFLAHPKVEPNGRVWNLGLSGKRAIVWTLAPDGSLEKAVPLALPRASYLHDFTATERHLVIVLQPWIQDRMTMPFMNTLSWKPELGTQILVVDKADLSRQRLYEAPSLFFFHLGDAWEDRDGTIRFDIATEKDPSFALVGGKAIINGGDVGPSHSHLDLVALHPGGGVEITSIGLTGEFPRTDPRFAGRSRGKTVHLTKGGKDRPLFQAVAVTDWRAEKTRSYDFGPNQIIEEMVLVPRPGSTSEFDGWLVGSSLNLAAQRTELHVLDARRVEAGPLVSWQADVALPVSLHGVFKGA
jgi:all-trans-8'-apo-beta-carotenal 15,15'-oxygenase